MEVDVESRIFGRGPLLGSAAGALAGEGALASSGALVYFGK